MNDSLPVRGSSSHPELPLALVRDLTERLQAAGAAYCHWKSNEHLLAAVYGDTDLDVLFDESARKRVLGALAASGFRRGRAVWHRRYPFIEDYLAVDRATGKLVHVHAHFRLLIGEESVKSFHLPWEAELLRTRQWDDQAGFFCAEPARELLLLLVRAAIKRQHPSLRRRVLARRESTGISDEQREFDWLKARVTLPELIDVADRQLGSQSITALKALYEGGPRDRELGALSSACDQFRKYRRRNPIATLTNRWARWFASFCALLARRIGLIDRLGRRSLEGDGVIVAVLGADGSGKSTLVKALDVALSKKLDVVRLYLGSGDGPSGLLRKPLVVMRGIRRQVLRSAESGKRQKVESATAVNRARWWSAVRAFERILWALTLAAERKAKLRKAQRARAAGRIVITDRYPQVKILGHNDGPLLAECSSSKWWLLRQLSSWEISCYRSENLPKPDLVLKLIGPAEVLHGRRPEMSVSEIDHKQRGILEIAFADDVNVVELNASQSQDAVLKRAMILTGRVLLQRACDAQRET